MLGSLVHRGPDDEGLQVLGGAVLGARRLAIIDLVSGNQPIGNEDGSVIAVQNGEIYNFRDLRAYLETRGHRFVTNTDTEVLPHAYEEWDTDFITRLRGMFALGLWDDRRKRLILARDRYGKKPLYYAVRGSEITFASEIQALLTQPDVDRAIDGTAIATYLTLGYVPAPATGFAQIAKIPPAHLLEFRAGVATTRRYWALPTDKKVELTLDEAAERLTEELDTAVRLRLIADVPVGAFLSGGLDSSTIVAFMAKHSVRPVKTFSVGFRDQGLNELPHARRVAEFFATDHHELVLDEADPGVLPLLAKHVGEPFADSSLVPTYHVARMTRSEVTVALTGDGGDELLAGYDRYRAVLLAEQLARAPRPLVAMALAGVRRFPDGLLENRLGRRVRRFTESLELPWDARYLRWIGYFVGADAASVRGERLMSVGPVDAAEHLRNAASLAITSDPVDRVVAADIGTYLPGDLLVKMDIATMANSLEARSPFLDHELGQFAATLPRTQKVLLGRSKIVLRHAMASVLPKGTVQREKRGFGAPVARWLLGPLRSLLEDTVLTPNSESGLVDRRYARVLWSDLQAGRSRAAPLIWNLLMLELWHRECVTSPTPRPL